MLKYYIFLTMLLLGSSCNNISSNKQQTQKQMNEIQLTPLVFSNNLDFIQHLENIYSLQGINGLTKWLNSELVDNRIISILNINNTKTIYDFSLSIVEQGRATKNIIAFKKEANSEDSVLMGTYNLLHTNPNFRLIIRAYILSEISTHAIEAK